jgi:hypothetical protein
MIPHAFEYHAPTSVPDAIALLGQYGDEAKLLAGGHSLLPMMKLRFAEPAHLIDLGRIPDLRGIVQVGNEIHIGAMTTENDLVWSPLLAGKVPLLVEGARWISDPQVRYKGTIGGDISHGDPGNDHPALMLALDASFALKGPNGERVVKADGFFLGLYSKRLGLPEAQAQGRRLRHRRIRRDAPDAGRHGRQCQHRPDQRRRDAAQCQSGGGIARRQADRRRQRGRGGTAGDGDLRSQPRPARRRRLQAGDGRRDDPTGSPVGAFARGEVNQPRRRTWRANTWCRSN